MGVRGEIFSTKVMLQNRTYFFNVKENRLGDIYLNIVESKNRDEGGFDRQSVILFAEDLQQFLQGFDESLKVMEKAAREKRRPKNNDAATSYHQNRQNPDRNGERGDNRNFDPGRQEGPRHFKKRSKPLESREQRPRHEPREQSHHESREHNPQYERKRKDGPRRKRVVVRKH
jgi:hypothetical protein